MASGRRHLAEPLENRVLLSTVYVDSNPAIATHDGLSWNTAYADLAPVLLNATSGTNIHVADGTYKPTTGADRTVSFALKNGVGLYGGYAGSGAADPNARDVAAYPAILSGDIGTGNDNTDNSYHVVVGSDTDSSAVLDGFTITKGNANGVIYSTYDGGGMYNSNGSPTLANCTISGNATHNGGGGICNQSSSPTLTNCAFIGNTASDYGGGMWNQTSSPILTNCTFSGNTASYYGGAMCNGYSSPTLTNCTFSGNLASSGGGMDNDSSSPTLANCTFSENTATDNGGGMYNGFTSSPTLTNCVFSGNTASIGGGMFNSSSSPTLTNCIVWGNSTAIYDDSNFPVVTYSDIQGGYAGTGNIDADPLFIRNPSMGPDNKLGTEDDDYGDLRLQAHSPCIDAGSNAAVPDEVTTDLAGRPRFVDVLDVADTGAGTAPLVDIGAYEATNPPTNIALSKLTVQEGLAIGTAVGSLSATDPDAGDVFTYSLVSGNGDSDNSAFTINGSSLKTAAIFNYAKKHVYSIRLRVSDAGGLTYNKAFTISVTASPKGTYKGTLFLDSNKNKKKDRLEKGMKTWRVYIDKDNDGVWDKRETSVLTDSKGNFTLSLSAGTYTLRAVLQKGYKFTTPIKGLHSFKIKSGQSITGKLFGVIKK